MTDDTDKKPTEPAPKTPEELAAIRKMVDELLARPYARVIIPFDGGFQAKLPAILGSAPAVERPTLEAAYSAIEDAVYEFAVSGVLLNLPAVKPTGEVIDAITKDFCRLIEDEHLVPTQIRLGRDEYAALACKGLQWSVGAENRPVMVPVVFDPLVTGIVIDTRAPGLRCSQANGEAQKPPDRIALVEDPLIDDRDQWKYTEYSDEAIGNDDVMSIHNALENAVRRLLAAPAITIEAKTKEQVVALMDISIALTTLDAMRRAVKP